MDYAAAYNRFIADRKSRDIQPGGPTEVHHILPRSMGGDDAPSNLVVLTPREHYFAHKLLAKIHGGKMNAALHVMSNARGKKHSVKTSRGFSKIYELPRKPRGKNKKKPLPSRIPNNPHVFEQINFSSHMRELGWSAGSLAEKLGIRRGTVYDWVSRGAPNYALAYVDLALTIKRNCSIIERGRQQ